LLTEAAHTLNLQHSKLDRTTTRLLQQPIGSREPQAAHKANGHFALILGIIMHRRPRAFHGDWAQVHRKYLFEPPPTLASKNQKYACNGLIDIKRLGGKWRM
jgi:hypothetical protein